MLCTAMCILFLHNMHFIYNLAVWLKCYCSKQWHLLLCSYFPYYLESIFIFDFFSRTQLQRNTKYLRLPTSHCSLAPHRHLLRPWAERCHWAWALGVRRLRKNSARRRPKKQSWEKRRKHVMRKGRARVVAWIKEARTRAGHHCRNRKSCHGSCELPSSRGSGLVAVLLKECFGNGFFCSHLEATKIWNTKIFFQ